MLGLMLKDLTRTGKKHEKGGAILKVNTQIQGHILICGFIFVTSGLERHGAI